MSKHGITQIHTYTCIHTCTYNFNTYTIQIGSIVTCMKKFIYSENLFEVIPVYCIYSHTICTCMCAQILCKWLLYFIHGCPNFAPNNTSMKYILSNVSVLSTHWCTSLSNTCWIFHHVMGVCELPWLRLMAKRPNLLHSPCISKQMGGLALGATFIASQAKGNFFF